MAASDPGKGRGLRDLPQKLKATLAVTWICVIFSIALILCGAKAYLYNFPDGAATATETASANSHKNTTLRWGVGPAIVVILSSLLGTFGIHRRSRPLIGVFVASTFLCVTLSLAGFGVPMAEGSWRSFSDSCKCVEDKCCDMGTSCTGEWHKSAYNCAAGGRGASYNCPAGQYRASLEVPCADCQFGTYKSGTGDGCCQACAASKMTAAKGSSTAGDCSGCAASCDIGASSASGSCAACPEGFFKKEQGAGCCTVCPTGTVSLPGREGCAPPNACPKGEYQPVSFSGQLLKGSCRSVNSCRACPAGKFGTVINNFGFCQSCPKGKHQPSSATSSCLDCPTGFFSDSVIKNQVCKGCSRGRYANQEGSSSCKGCSSGKTGPVLSKSSNNCVAVRGRMLHGTNAARDAADAASLAAAEAQLREQQPELQLGALMVSGGPRDWRRRQLANATAAVGKNCNADPASIQCCYNTEHSTFCNNFLTSLNAVIYLNLVNAILLSLLFVIAINTCREKLLFKTQLGPPKQEKDDEDDASAEEGGGDAPAPAPAPAQAPAALETALAAKGKKGGKKAKVVL